MGAYIIGGAVALAAAAVLLTLAESLVITGWALAAGAVDQAEQAETRDA